MKTIEVEGKKVKVQIWDSPGGERLRQLSKFTMKALWELL